MLLAEKVHSIDNDSPLRAGVALSSDVFQTIRRQMVLDNCKWDPQVGDVATISSFPLLLSEVHWRELSNLSKLLSAELFEAEQELLAQPNLHRLLGLPRRVRSILRQVQRHNPTPSAARVLRFDFHWTTLGWQISEVNSDVPGGFSEASELPLAMSKHYAHTRSAGNPGLLWATAIDQVAPCRQPIALLAAPGFLEDQQVLAYFADHLTRLSRIPIWISIDDLCWNNGHAFLTSSSNLHPIGVIVRFFQAEWLPRNASHLFVGGRTPVTNPGVAVITESKRFPLVRPLLSTCLPTWRKLLPVTVDPREADWQHDDSWLVKSAFCNTGDTVAIRSLQSESQWRTFAKAVIKQPHAWIAQKRFSTRAVLSPAGPIYPCIGVYTINGEPAGIYARFSHTPVINYAATDIAVLIDEH